MNRSEVRQFDLDALRMALEQRNVERITNFYTDDAEMEVVDRLHPPSNPLRLHGKQAITNYYEDICSRDVTHKIENELLGGSRAAFTEACQYKDGKRVLCTAFLDTRDGAIMRQTDVVVWDG